MSHSIIVVLRGFIFTFLLVILVCFNHTVYSQSKYNSESWLPKNLNINLSSDGKLGLSKKDPGFALNEFRLRTTLTLKNNNSIVSLVRSRVTPGNKWYEFNKRATRLTELYFQFSDNFTLPQGSITVNSQLGKLEWYPRFTDPQQIIDNLNLFLNPPNYYGGNLFLNYNIIPKWNVNFYTGATTGDIINNNEKASIHDAYFMIYPEIVKDLHARIQFGKIQGTKYFFNEAYLNYSPLIHKGIRLDLRLGNLPAIDKTPYGGRIGIEGEFKYIAIGGYYEHRINQRKKDNKIFGIYWSILGPEFLAKFFISSQLLYDTNTDTFRFIIPFLNLDLH